MTLLKLLEKSVDYCFSLIPRPRPEQMAISEAKLIAHRGAHDGNQKIIENTDAAFARALALGCWGIELDIRKTADNILVVNHDATLKRLWKKNIAINELNFAKLRQLVPQVPSLQEVVNKYGKRMHLLIELKAPFSGETELAEVLRQLTPGEDFHLLSLDESIFASCSQFPREAMLLVAGSNNVNKFCRLSVQQHYGGVLGHYLLLSKHKIKKLQAANHQRVGVGFVDSKFALYRELNRGVRWVFSNNIGLLSSCLEELKKE